MLNPMSRSEKCRPAIRGTALLAMLAALPLLSALFTPPASADAARSGEPVLSCPQAWIPEL
jgi:hypothetical protein